MITSHRRGLTIIAEVVGTSSVTSTIALAIKVFLVFLALVATHIIVVLSSEMILVIVRGVKYVVLCVKLSYPNFQP